jgi:hypothetical protein
MNTYLHRCTSFPKTETIVTIDFTKNWAVSTSNPEHNFPIYKPCCSFYKINEDDTVTNEKLDFSQEFPRLIIETDEQ